MAKIRSKQLNPKFTGSFSIYDGSLHVSGSDNPTAGSYILMTSGSINTTGTGRVYEEGTSVIDHATAMAIVFGG
jgi:hypothetical protein|tara:strand:+ start:264 stop:485 length:222 start_codon:yes stop_codon:yes gene_type:complete